MEHQAGILRSFLAQLERQEAAGEEAPNGFAGEFARLKSQSTKYRTDKTYPTKTAEKQDNVKKNRYKDIVPFDHSRVRLNFTTSKNDSDYINASFIEGVSGSRAYIATQGPLPHTVIDFLRMLWEYNVKVVVMACREFELGKKKCECYWPQKQGQPLVCEPFTVYCDSEENKGDYLTRTLRVTYRSCSRTLKQLQYVTWPDHGVPDSIPPILEMLNEMRSEQAHDDTPICIHCSAGCGRTGALCVIDYTWNLLKKQMITPDFNIYELVQNMRTQRPSLVQTKEQYELVYRTIRLLFERYLQAMDAHRNEVTVVPSPIAADTKGKLSDLSEGLDTLQQIQQVVDDEVLPQCQAPSPSPSKNLIVSGDKDTQRDQQQWHRLRTLPEALVATQDLLEEPQSDHTSQRAPAVEESKDIPSLNPSPLPAMAAAMCLMVEDPYFDTPMSSPSSDEAPMDCSKYPGSPICCTPSVCLNDETLELNSGTVDTDEEAPPPLPQRTPESYVLAVVAERPDPCERLTVIIPSNAAAEAVRELRGSSPPSPVPPLPERTPESFELDIDQAPMEQTLRVAPAVDLSRIGMSSEWWGNSKQAATASQSEMAPLSRSRSLKGKLTFTVAPADFVLDTSNHHLYGPPWDPLTPPLLPKTEERIPQSFALTAEYGQEDPALYPQPLQTAHPSPRIGLSSEWDGTSQPKEFLHVKNRSKSVRAKSSSTEPLPAAQQLTSPPIVMAEGGSAHVDVNRRPSLNTETPGNRSDKSQEKGMSRTRSLKFFRYKQKPKATPPSSPTQTRAPAPLHSASLSAFRFGFGNRFRKPKGPRSYPETWV